MLKSSKDQILLFNKMIHELQPHAHEISNTANILEKNWDLLDNNACKEYVNAIYEASKTLANLIVAAASKLTIKDHR